MSSLTADALLAHLLATAAGDVLLGVRRAGGGDPFVLARRGDRVSNELLVSELRRRRPDDAVLSEEEADDERRRDAERVWIIDPLDGSREFGEPGRADWAVHVALAVQGKVRVGAVAVPAVGRTWSSLSKMPPRPPHAGRPPVLVSRTRPAVEAEVVAAAVGGVLSAMGSAGVKTVAVVTGTADVYLHSGGQYEWDVAAPVAVAAAAGLHVSRLDGSPLRFNRPSPWLPDLLVCTKGLAVPILTAVRAARARR